MKPQEYRKIWKEKRDIISDWVDENYEELWNLSREASNISSVIFIVETEHGTIQFIPK